MDFIPILFSQSFTTKSSNNATSNSIKTNITSNPIATSTTTTTTNTIDTGLTTSLSSLSLHALDLVYNEKSDDVSGELSSILTSTAPVNVQRRQSLAQLSKLSNTIFSVISNTAVNPVNTGNPGINNTGFNELDLLTNSSVYSNNQFSPHRVESLTSIDTLSLYNYQLDTSPLMIQPMDLQRRFVDDEYQKLPPDPLFEEQFPIFQFSPESDVF